MLNQKNTSGYKLINIYICDNIIEGRVSSVSADGEVEINGVSYECAYSLKQLDENDIYSLPPNGTEGKFYIDINGKIANYERIGVSDEMKFAVVSKAYYDDVESALIVKLYNQDGEWHTLSATEKINIDGVRYKDFAQAADVITPGEVIRYVAKNKDTISRIDTSALNRGNNNKISDRGNLNEFVSGTQFEHRLGMCNELNKPYENKFTFTSGEVYVFTVPVSTDYNVDKESYSVSRTLPNGYFGKNAGNSWISVKEGYKVYNTAETDINIADVILLKGSSSNNTESMTSQTELVVISGFAEEYDDEYDEVVNTIEYWSSGGVKSNSIVADTVE